MVSEPKADMSEVYPTNEETAHRFYHQILSSDFIIDCTLNCKVKS